MHQAERRDAFGCAGPCPINEGEAADFDNDTAFARTDGGAEGVGCWQMRPGGGCLLLVIAAEGFDGEARTHGEQPPAARDGGDGHGGQ